MPAACNWDLDIISTACQETDSLPLELFEKAAGKQDPRHWSSKESRQALCSYTFEAITIEMTDHVTKIFDDRLLKKLINEFSKSLTWMSGKRLHCHYEKSSLKDLTQGFNTPSYSCLNAVHGLVSSDIKLKPMKREQRKVIACSYSTNTFPFSIVLPGLSRQFRAKYLILIVNFELTHITKSQTMMSWLFSNTND